MKIPPRLKTFCSRCDTLLPWKKRKEGGIQVDLCPKCYEVVQAAISQLAQKTPIKPVLRLTEVENDEHQKTESQTRFN